MVLLPLYYGAETTQIWCYHHSKFLSSSREENIEKKLYS